MAKYASRLQRKHDPLTGIVEILFSQCNLQSADDAREFFRDLEEFLREVPKPRDVVICLDELIVAPAGRPTYGEERAHFAKTQYRYSARYAGTSATKIATMTSAVRYQAEGMVYETREAAYRAILEQRKQHGR